MRVRLFPVRSESQKKLLNKVREHNELKVSVYVYDTKEHCLLPCTSLNINTQCLETLTRAGDSQYSCVVQTKKSRKNPKFLISENEVVYTFCCF